MLMSVAVTPVVSPAGWLPPPAGGVVVVQAVAAKRAAAVAIMRPRRAKRCIEHRPFLVWLRVALELRDGGALSCRTVVFLAGLCVGGANRLVRRLARRPL